MLSRFIDPDDWSVHPSVFRMLDARFGPHTFNIYIFNHGIWFEAVSNELDPHLAKLMKDCFDLQTASKATSTISKYASNWKDWHSWVSSNNGISLLPARPLHVALFLTEKYLSCLEKNQGVSTIESAIYAIR